jgi:hypothetical protein
LRHDFITVVVEYNGTCHSINKNNSTIFFTWKKIIDASYINAKLGVLIKEIHDLNGNYNSLRSKEHVTREFVP